MNNKTKGKQGELLAVEYLKNKGIKIIETNWHYSRFGEIDIIAEDKKNLVFIEVKTRSSLNFGHPLEAINNRKMAQINSVAMAYINQNSDKKYKGYRFDAIAVILSKNPEITHYKDIYQF